MTTKSLISKLTKLSITHSVIDYNGFNQEIKFTINDLVYFASYNVKDTIIDYFYCNHYYDNANQEMNRTFYHSFNQILRYSK
jgi:hypothetical protein